MFFFCLIVHVYCRILYGSYTFSLETFEDEEYFGNNYSTIVVLSAPCRNHEPFCTLLMHST